MSQTQMTDREHAPERTFRGRTLEEILPQVREQLGGEALIVAHRDTLGGGFAGFFQRRVVEVDARPAEMPSGIDVHATGSEPDDPALAAPRPDAEPWTPRRLPPGEAYGAVALIGRSDDVAPAQPPATFAEQLAATGWATHDVSPVAVADEADEIVDAEPEPEPEHVPERRGAQSRPPLADTLERSLVEGGLAPRLAAALVAETVSHLMPFGSPRQLKRLVRSALARRIPVQRRFEASGRRVAIFVGAPGAGKTLCSARLATAYATGSDLPVLCLALRSRDGGAELRELAPDVEVVEVADGAEARGRIDALPERAMVVVDTPGVSPGAVADVQALAADLEAVGPSDVLLSTPATLSAPAAAELARGLAPLEVSALALTHADETRSLGYVLELALTWPRPFAYVSRGTASEGELEPADAAALAAQVLP